MANILASPNNNNNHDKNSNSSGVSSLRDVCNFLQQPTKPVLNLQADEASYDHIVDMIRGLDLQDDGIEMNRKVKSIEIDFCNIVHNEDVLCESMEYMNNKALADAETSLKFAMLFSSRSFDALAMNDTKVRCTMLKILETNFINAEIYRTQDRNRLYNSLTMLGEYYHRVRLADNSPVKILGQSLLTLLEQELSDTQIIDVRLAKLILSQVTLNGRLLDALHQPQLSQVFYHIRRQLIEQPTLSATIKALLLMTLDMYYSNFGNINKELEDMYTKYFLQGEQEEAETQRLVALNEQLNSSQLVTMNGNHSGSFQESPIEASTPPETTTTKKWSEQVCEDSYVNAFCENSWNDSYVNLEVNNDVVASTTAITPPPAQKINAEQLLPEIEHNKAMPRWRATRFNRDNVDSRNEKQTTVRGNYDDDQHSVRSEGGSIRLYSINDRLKHSQEKIERTNATSGGGQNYYNAASIANSNWDHQSQRDDRSERSYVSNYERGHAQRRRHTSGGHYHNNNNNNNNNNKQTYDKPPRFQKQQQQQQQQQLQQQQKNTQQMNSWRRRLPRGNSSPRDDFMAGNENYTEFGSVRHARTLPRPNRAASFDQGDENQQHAHMPTISYRRRSSQSPGQLGQARQYRDRTHNNNNNHHNNNMHHNRYSSQSSLASEASSVYMNRQKSRQYQSNDRQHNNNNSNSKHTRNYKNNPNYNKNVINNEKDWNNEKIAVDTEDVDGEIVKNAQHTTKYMHYLSQK